MWRNLGGAFRGVETTPFSAAGPSATFDTAGALHVAFSQGSSSGTTPAELYVRRWTGSTWAAVGLPLNAVSEPGTPVLEMDLEPTPTGLAVAWFEQRSIFAATYDGSTWSRIPSPIVSTGTLANSPSLAVDPEGRLIIAWVDRLVHVPPAPAAWDVRVSRWDGSAWVAIGEPASHAVIGVVQGSGPSMRLNRAGNPIVAFGSLGPVTGTFAVEWDGLRWVALGSPLRSATNTFHSLALSSCDDVWIAIDARDDVSAPTDVHVFSLTR